MRAMILAGILFLGGCVFQTTVTPDLITYEYDVAVYSVADMQARADAHCSNTGRRAQLAGQGGRWAMPTVTFQCVPR